MIWSNPWAWAGLLTLAVPLLVHLIGRRRPAPLAFPTLRFVTESRLVPARRHRLNDIPLMLVRMAILLLAVAALAQPAFLRGGDASDARARVVIVDTSASMNRPTQFGQPAIAVARVQATALAGEASSSRVIETAAVRDALDGAVAWLTTQPGLDELAIVSDFQSGTLTGEDVATLAPHVGLVLDRIAGSSSASPAAVVEGPTGLIELRLQVDREATTASWRPASVPATASVVTVVAGDADRPAAEAAVEAARTDGLLVGDGSRRVVLVLDSAPERAALARRVQPLAVPWMFDVVRAVTADPTIAALARDSVGTAMPQAPASASPVVRHANGAVLVSAASEDVDGSARLVLFAGVDARSTLLASLLATASQAASAATPMAELDPGLIPIDALASWQREPSAAPISPVADRTRSDGRWLWAGVPDPARSRDVGAPGACGRRDDWRGGTS